MPRMRSGKRQLRVLLLILLATAVVALTMALMSVETGLAEKIVLNSIIAACVYLAARVPTYVERLLARLHHP
jgi:hypothetical protein